MMATNPEKDLLANLAIVLMQPKYPENVGAAARVCRNMGISRLLVINDQPLDMERVRKMATHHATDLADTLQTYSDLADALAPFSTVIGASARHGRQRRTLKTPREMARQVLPQLAENRVALLFGPEDRGLTNEDLEFCTQTVTIPTADFSSLNLAQAVAILSYEIRTVFLERDQGQLSYSPKLAESHELEGMYGHIAEVLRTVGFLKENDWTYWMRNIRQFVSRLGLRGREVRMIRGICRQFLWHEKNKIDSNEH